VESDQQRHHHPYLEYEAYVDDLTLGAFVKGVYPGIEEYSALVQPDSYDSLEPGFSESRVKTLADWQDVLELDRYRTRTRGKEHLGQPIWTGPEVWGEGSMLFPVLKRTIRRIGRAPGTSGSIFILSVKSDTVAHSTIFKPSNVIRNPSHVPPTRLICAWHRLTPTRYTEWEIGSTRIGEYTAEVNADNQMAWKSAIIDAECPQDDPVVSGAAGTPTVQSWWFLAYQVLSQVSDLSLLPIVADISFAHDGSTAAVLGILQADYPIWPGMASEIVFELWQKGQDSYIRVLFSGQPLVTSTPLGVLDMIKYEEFVGYLETVLPKDIVKACQSL
jgi:hypothetical protein